MQKKENDVTRPGYQVRTYCWAREKAKPSESVKRCSQFSIVLVSRKMKKRTEQTAGVGRTRSNIWYTK
jgi:hypothetical protein